LTMLSATWNLSHASDVPLPLSPVFRRLSRHSVRLCAMQLISHLRPRNVREPVLIVLPRQRPSLLVHPRRTFLHEELEFV